MDALAAKKNCRKRPAKPRLWILSAGRPTSVLHGHALAPMRGYPRGFYRGAPAAAVGVVVVSELPRDRSTLFFRLFGAGDVLVDAVKELAALPPGAWEREAAMEELVALRVEMPDTPRDDEERRLLMATQDLYQQWKQRTLQEGIQQGIQQGAAGTLLGVYEARFGEAPARLRAAIEAQTDGAMLKQWSALIATRPEDEIAEAILGPQSATPPRRRPAARRTAEKARRR